MTSEYFVVRRGSTALSNDVIRDKGLSYDAIGLLLVMLTMPAGAPMGYRNLVGRGAGEKSVREALGDLEARGFRWRLTVRKRNRLRTVVIVYDQPTDESTALADGQRLARTDQITVASTCIKNEQKPLSLCADHAAAHNDKAKYDESVADQDDPGKTPSRCVQTLRRPRPSVAAVRSAQPSNDGSNGWETNVSQPNQTKPPRPIKPAAPDPPDAAGRVGLGLGRLLDSPVPDVDSVDWDVVVSCLPSAMRNLEASAVPVIANALRERLDAGWEPEKLHATLAGNALPPQVDNLPGLVAYRIKTIPINPPRRSPRRTVSAEAPAEPAGAVVVPLALRKRAEARSARSPDAGKPLSWWIERFPGTVPVSEDEGGSE